MDGIFWHGLNYKEKEGHEKLNDAVLRMRKEHHDEKSLYIEEHL